LIVSLSGADTPNTATPSDVLAQAKARIESLKQAGYLKTEGDSIIIDILYDKGNLTVNGKSLAAGAGNSVTIPVGAVSNTPAVVHATPATSAAPAANSGDASKATANSDVGTSPSTVAPATQK